MYKKYTKIKTGIIKLLFLKKKNYTKNYSKNIQKKTKN